MPGSRIPRFRLSVSREPRDEHEHERKPRRRGFGGFNPIWGFFWLILLIILLGLIFGGYRKGTPVHNPGQPLFPGRAAVSVARVQ